MDVGKLVCINGRSKDAHIEARVVGKDDAALKAHGDVLPEVGKFVLVDDVFRIDAVDFRAAFIEVQAERMNEMVPFIDDFVSVACDDSKRAGIGGAPVRRFKVKCNIFHGCLR